MSMLKENTSRNLPWYFWPCMSSAFCLREDCFANCLEGQGGWFPHFFSFHLCLISSLFALLQDTNKRAPWASGTQQCEEAKSHRSKLVFRKYSPGIQNWGRCAGDEKCPLISLQHNDELALLFQNQAQAPRSPLLSAVVSEGTLPY